MAAVSVEYVARSRDVATKIGPVVPTFDAADVSNNQGSLVTTIGPQLVALGASGWWCKATQSDGFRDRYWPACREARIDNRLRYGGPYHWLQPNHDVGAQFANFAGYVGDLLPGECIQLDVEDPGGLPDGLVFDFIDLCEARWPGRVIVYTGRWYMPYKPGKIVLSYLIDRLIAHYGDDLKWWLPWYASSFPAGLPVLPVMWQWAGGANGVEVEGVGRIDSNQIIDRDRLELLCGYGDPLDPSEDDMTPEQEAKLDAVIAGNAAIWNVLTQPIEGTSEPSMQWCSVLTQSSIAKGQLQDQTAAAVVKTLTADQRGLTEAEAVAAVAEKLSS